MDMYSTTDSSKMPLSAELIRLELPLVPNNVLRIHLDDCQRPQSLDVNVLRIF